MAGNLNIPLKLNLKDGHQTIGVIGDTHHPHHDYTAIRIAESILVDTQPDILIYNGDLCDFYQVSVFAKDPARIHLLQKDIDMVKNMFKKHKRLLPNTKKFFIAGTHEHRFEKFMWSNAKELSSLKALTIPELYELNKYDIDYIPFEQGLMVNKVFLILHGDLVSVHSAYTAKRAFEKHGGCGIVNHTHRGGSFYKRDRFGTWGWWENFCLCSLNPDWIQNPNWQQGFSMVHFTDHSRFFVEQIPIIEHKVLFRGKVYR